jgi:hypothetical protein
MLLRGYPITKKLKIQMAHELAARHRPAANPTAAAQ